MEGHEEAVLRGEWRRSDFNSTFFAVVRRKIQRRRPRPRGGGPRGAGHAAVRPWCSFYRAVVLEAALSSSYQRGAQPFGTKRGLGKMRSD